MTQPFLTDTTQSLQREEDDFFGHGDYAVVVANTVATAPAPFTLGLFAPWGTGKSSVLEDVQERLDDDVAFASFDAWRYEGLPLRRAFLREIPQQLNKDHVTKGWKQEEHEEHLLYDTPVVRPRLEVDLRAVLRALFFAGVAGAVLYGANQIVTDSGVSDENAAKIMLALGGAATAFLLTLFKDTLRLERPELTRKRLEHADEFADSFATFLTDGLKAKRLVIAIDNLDRCAPDRVTEILGTIKTFLEPGASDKELIFIIAADDAALRRHLIAQELDRSGVPLLNASSESPSDENDDEADKDPANAERVPDTVSDAVDEYLRKFFNARLRIAELLDEDTRKFAQAQLAKFVQAHELDEATELALVELLATALKRNPRRLKQFINDLEMRLRILTQRRTANRIQIDPDVLVVAKLAVVEEAFPERYARLREEPKALAKWHREAKDGRDSGEAFKPGVDRAWFDFLRVTERITAPNLLPYLRLTQTEIERVLPRFGDFQDAVESGRADAADEILNESGELRAKYVEQVPGIFSRAINAGYDAAAINTLRSALAVPALRGLDGRQARDMISSAVATSRLRDNLRALEPAALVESSQDVDDDVSQELLAIMLEEFDSADDDAGESRLAISNALATVPDRITDRHRRLIRSAMKSEPTRRDFKSYVPLAALVASALPIEVLRDAVNTMETAVPLVPEEESYIVARSILAAGAGGEDEAQKFVVHVVDSIVQHASGDTEIAGALAEDAAGGIRRAEVAISAQQALAQLTSAWAQLPEEEHPRLMTLAEALVEASGENMHAHADEFSSRYFNEETERAIEWARHAELGDAFSKSVTTQLLAVASGGVGVSEVWGAATDLLARREDGAERLQEAVRKAITEGRHPRAAELLMARKAELADAFDMLVDELLDAATNGAQKDLKAHVGLTEILSPEKTDAVGSLLGDYLWEDIDAARPAFDAASEVQHSSRLRTRAIGRLLERVLEHGPLHQHSAQVRFLLERQDQLSDAQATQLGEQLVQAVIDYPQQVEVLAPLLAPLEQQSPRIRDDWTRRLILHERGQPQLSQREVLLRNLQALAGRRNSNAAIAVGERLEEMKRGGDAEKELAEKLLNEW